MGLRHLDVTASTTLDLVDVRAVGEDWSDGGTGVVDVESPRDSDTVSLQVELDPVACDAVAHHADTVTLSPEEARHLAADLERAAAAATTGESMTSGRSR